MKYMLVITHDPAAWPAEDAPAPTAGDGVIDTWPAYTRALHEAGVLVDGMGLQGNETATTVRLRDGRRLVTDGPFAETKEHLIGYYVIDVPDLDSALDWAAKIPVVRTGTVEVRPCRPDSGTEPMLARAAAEDAATAPA